MKLVAKCEVFMGDGTTRMEPSEFHVNPSYIVEAWPGPNIVRLQGRDELLSLDDESFAKVVRWLGNNEIYRLDLAEVEA